MASRNHSRQRTSSSKSRGALKPRKPLQKSPYPKSSLRVERIRLYYECLDEVWQTGFRLRHRLYEASKQMGLGTILVDDDKRLRCSSLDEVLPTVRTYCGLGAWEDHCVRPPYRIAVTKLSSTIDVEASIRQAINRDRAGSVIFATSRFRAFDRLAQQWGVPKDIRQIVRLYARSASK